MLDILWNIGAFIVALGLLIAFHEYGHFWVARKAGVKVERFSIGFGKSLISWHDKKGTEFVIALIPLGGYVKMLDGRVDDVPEALKNQAFNEKSVWARIAIIAAGPLANFVFAIFALWLMYLIGVPTVKPVVGSIASNSIAEQSGLTKQAEIIMVNGRHTPDWESVNLGLVASIGEDSAIIRVKDANSSLENDYTLDLQQWTFDPDKTSTLDSLGITPFRPQIQMAIGRIVAGGAAAKAGLQEGDLILGVERTDVFDWQEFVSIVQNNPNNSIEIAIERDGYQLLYVAIPEAKESAKGKLYGYLGISPKIDPWPENYRVNLQFGPLAALEQGIKKTGQLIHLSFSMIGKLITGHVSVKNLSGPISIAQGAGASANFGLVYFLSFLALISVNLGVINLLPLPILDGGHLFFYFIELIRRKPVSEKIQEIGFRIGAVFIFLLMSIAIFNDILRLQ